jgi:integrase
MGIYYNAERDRWVAQVTYQGRRDSKSCRTRAEARLAESDLLQALTTAAAEVPAPDSLRAVCDGYLADLTRRRKSPDSIARASDTVKRVRECFGARVDQPVSEFGAPDLHAFRAARIDQGVKPSTLNRDLRTIRTIWKRALPDRPFPRGLFLAEDETRVRWLEPEQEAAVLPTLRSPFREMVRLAMLTLMRLTEIRTLRRHQISLARGIVTLPKAKGGPGSVVLNQEALAILRTQLSSHIQECVFPNPHGGPYSRVHVGRIWRTAARSLGLRGFAFHDLRHHGATRALNAGFSGQIVMALGRWKSERMMRRYAAVTDRTWRAAAEALSGSTQPTPDHPDGTDSRTSV